MEAPFFSKPLQTTQPIRMQGQQKILPPAGEEGHPSNEECMTTIPYATEAIRMQDF